MSNASQFPFPKYATQIINLLNSNAQGTRPKVVGQMSELIQEFDGNTIQEWIEWYSQRNPNAVQDATERIYNMYIAMKDAFNSITKEMIEAWVKDLVYTKTFCGLKFQSAILAYIANSHNTTWRLADINEEAQGIDGYIGSCAVQIKPITYKMEKHLSEVIDVPIIYYEKKKNGINIEYDDIIFS